MSNFPATRFTDTITLPSQACGCEQLTRDEASGQLRYHRKLVAVSILPRRPGLGTRLRYHRKLLAVSCRNGVLGLAPRHAEMGF